MTMRTTSNDRGRRADAEGGVALIAVILVLLALVAIATPFSLSMRNQLRAATHQAKQSKAEQTLRSALTLAEEALAKTEVSRDDTPHWDDRDELAVSLSDEAKRFGIDANEPRGTIFSVRSRDEQGLVNVNQTSLFALHNVFMGTFLSAELSDSEALEIRVEDPSHLAEQGIVWIDGELILYRGVNGRSLTGLQRAFTTSAVRSREARTHASGAPVVDYRVLLAYLRPYKLESGQFIQYPTVRSIKDVGRFGEVAIQADEVDAVERHLTVHSVLPASGPFVGAARVIYDADPSDPEPALIVSGGRNLGPGSLVRIRTAERVEYNLVVEARPLGEDRYYIGLQEPLQVSIRPDEAIVDALARAPVNVNSASSRVLIALMAGLHLVGVPDRIDVAKAALVAERIVQSRPVAGEGGFAKLVNEMLGEGTITSADRDALLVNAECAQDTRLEVGTAPFVYRSYGVFSFDAATSENLAAGREEARAFARQVSQVTPAGEQLCLYDSQTEFEEAMRLSRAGKFWESRPTNLRDPDDLNEPPLRLDSKRDGRTPAIEVDEKIDSYVAPAPTRADGRRDATAFLPEGMTERMLHFDPGVREDEPPGSENGDGYDTKDKGPLVLANGSDLVGIFNPRGWVQPFAISFWWQPGEDVLGAETYFFDTGFLDEKENAEITNRILAYFDGTDLVFRVADNTVPDLVDDEYLNEQSRVDPTTLPQQIAEIRYAFDDGLPFDPSVPYHLGFYARGTKPTDLQLYVDGIPRGKRLGQTWLTEDVGGPANAGPFANIPGYQVGQREKIKVNDATRFPPYGIVRIDEELLEYNDRTDTELILARPTGEAFGGRARRGSRGNRHLASEAVELYGYVGVLLSERIPNGNVGMQNPMGAFGVAMVDPDSDAVKRPINWYIEQVNQSQQIGFGMDETVTQIPVVPLGGVNSAIAGSASSAGATPVDQLFDRQGGYALVVSAAHWPPANGTGTRTIVVEGQQITVDVDVQWKTDKGAIIGHGELIYYASFSNNTLLGVARAPTSALNTKWYPNGHSNLVEGGGPDQPYERQIATVAHAHVFQWFSGWPDSGYDPNQPIYVLPISVRPGLGESQLPEQYAEPQLRGDRTLPEMVQVGTGFLGNEDGGGTEWIRYDVMGNGCFVRDDPTRLLRATDLLDEVTAAFTIKNAAGNLPTAEAVARALNYEEIAATMTDKVQIAAEARVQPGRLDGGVLAFRGVLGTESKAHPAGARVLPVFRTFRNQNVWAARPGARDYVTCYDPVTQSREQHRINYGYCEVDVEGWGGFGCHVAFDTGVSGEYRSNFFELFSSIDPKSPGAAMNDLQNQNIESRDLTRLLKFPSGELPDRLSDEIYFGGDLNGEPSPARVVIDEVEFFTPTTPSDALPRHARFRLSRDDDFRGKLYVWRPGLRYNLWDRDSASVEVIDPLRNLPSDGYVLQIDEELIAISDVILEDQSKEGELEVAVAGRGYLGTPIQFHPAGAAVREVTFLRISRLEETLSETSNEIVVADASDFPARGYVLIDRELIGFVRREGNILVMPSVTDPDLRRPVGMLRGRFGTRPEAHSEGSMVLVFPARYEDRYRPRVDDPDLSYLALFVKGKGAFFRELTWQEENTSALADLVVLGRVGARGAWTDAPGEPGDLFLFDGPATERSPNSIRRQGDDLELRVFARYGPDAFDSSVFDPDHGAIKGGSNEWKRAPRLRLLGVDWIAGPARLEYEEWR